MDALSAAVAVGANAVTGGGGSTSRLRGASISRCPWQPARIAKQAILDAKMGRKDRTAAIMVRAGSECPILSSRQER